MRRLFVTFLVISSFWVNAQELNCNVTVVAQLTGNENNVVFQTLERQLREFINNTKWTDKTFSAQEKIECSMVINVSNYVNDNFAATLQIQSSRPVFNSSYSSPTYNFNDKDFSFQYLEFQNLVYNPNQYESNLISVIAFHIYMVLGMDADTFALNGGDEYFRQAQIIANYSQQEAFKGWRLEDGLQSRFALIDNILSPTFSQFRTTMYAYHREGLDIMGDQPREAKQVIATNLRDLKKMHARRPNSFLMRVFFDAKADEVTDIFRGGPSVNIAELMNDLNTIAPLYSSKWRDIKF